MELPPSPSFSPALSFPVCVSGSWFLCRACGARIVSRTDELREEDVGTGARLFEVKKIGDEYFAFITDCKEPKACTIILRGASKEILAVSSCSFCCPSSLSLGKSLLPFGAARSQVRLPFGFWSYRIPISWAALYGGIRVCPQLSIRTMG